MGCGSYSSSDWQTYSRSTSTKSTHQIFTRDTIDPDLNPKNIKIRESRDSADHSESCPIAVFTDVTGSMGYLAKEIAQKGVGVLFEELLTRQPVKDPQLLFGAIGDVLSDEAPLQVSQFESSNVIIPQLEKLYLEGNGGSNKGESYDAPWYFMATHTSCDAFEKRGKKGYLFTIGDEPVPHGLPRSAIKKFIGDDSEGDLTKEQILSMAERQWEVFHIVVGNYNRYGDVMPEWRNLLGERAVRLKDHTKLAELIVSLIQVNEGCNKKQVIDSWNGDTSVVIRDAIASYAHVVAFKSESGLVTL